MTVRVRQVSGASPGSWGETVVVHGTAYDLGSLPALVAEQDGLRVGVLTYHVGDDGLEIVTVEAFARHHGVGTALVDAACELARERGLGRVWLVTTNDNLDAVRFYQRRGFRLVAVAPGAADEARSIKPSIPFVGEYGIEIHDELTLERGVSRPAPRGGTRPAGR